MIQDELRAGARRQSGTDRGAQYREAIAEYGDIEAVEPPTHARTLGDLVDPTRAEAMRDVVNAVSRDIQADAAGWDVDRLLGMVRLMHAERRQRKRQQRS